MGRINFLVVRRHNRRIALRIKSPEVQIIKSGNTYRADSAQISLTYAWTVTGATLISGQGTDTITVTGTPTAVSVTVTNGNGKTGSAVV